MAKREDWWRSCSVRWDYLHEGAIACLFAVIKSKDGEREYAEIVGGMREMPNGKVLLDLFREELRPARYRPDREFESYKDATEWLLWHRNFDLIATRWMAKRFQPQEEGYTTP